MKDIKQMAAELAATKAKLELAEITLKLERQKSHRLVSEMQYLQTLAQQQIAYGVKQ